MEKTLASLINDFSFRLLNQIAARSAGDNLVLSPASVFLALAIICSGTRGATQEEIARVLNVRGEGSQEVEAVASELLPLLSTPQQVEPPSASTVDSVRELPDLLLQETMPSLVRVATALWSHQALSYTSSFLEVNRQVYNAKLAPVDFNDPAVAHLVNAWVRQQTDGKIPQIVDRFEPLRMLCLVTTLYFQGAWSQPFNPAQTKDGAFHRRDGHRITVPLMREMGHFAYVAHEDFQAIALPYQSSRHAYEMCIVRPRETSDITRLTARLTAAKWETWMARLAFQLGTIVLPRFSIHFAVDPDLNDSLQMLGMERAFEPQAEFSGLFSNPSALGVPLFLSRIIHKATLDVNEEGTIASAITAEMLAGGGGFVQEVPFTMIVDRPFLCSIRHRHSGTLLFLGIIEDPSRRG